MDGDPDGQTELPRGGPQYAWASKIPCEAVIFAYVVGLHAKLMASFYRGLLALGEYKREEERERGRNFHLGRHRFSSLNARERGHDDRPPGWTEVEWKEGADTERENGLRLDNIIFHQLRGAQFADNRSCAA